jgi:thymidylate kinase
MRKLTTLESNFLDIFFKSLKSYNIPFAVLRNYSELPTHMGKDLDILIDPDSLMQAHNCLCETAQRFNGFFLKVYTLQFVTATWVKLPGDQPMQIDLYPDPFSWKGITFLPPQQVLETRLPKKEFFVLDPAYEAIILFITSIIWGGFAKSAYQQRIDYLLKESESAALFNNILDNVFYQKKTTSWHQLASSFSTYNNKVARCLAIKLRFSLILRGIFLSPLKSLQGIFSYWCRELCYFKNPIGLHIVFLGPDGAGKSTLISLLQETLKGYFSQVIVFHWRSRLFPDFGDLLRFGKDCRSQKPTSDPHAKQPHNLLVGCLRLIYYWLEYWISYPPLRSMMRADSCVLFDRYSYDMFIDSKRYRYQLPQMILRFFSKKVPSPDFVFCLDAPVSVLQSRKQEVSPEETARQRDAYKSFANSLNNGYVIDTSGSLQNAIQQIESIIIKRLRTQVK